MKDYYHDSRSVRLRGFGFLAYVFLFSRALAIVALGVVVGMAAHFIIFLNTFRVSPPATVLAILVITSAALLWTVASWSGYSRRFFPYPATWLLDLMFLVPFTILSILLGRPLMTVNTCAAVPASQNSYTVVVPPGTEFGRITFPAEGQRSCYKVMVMWIAMLVACVVLFVSAVSVIALQLRERKAGMEAYDYEVDVSDPTSRPGRAFFTQRPITLYPKKNRETHRQWDSFGNEKSAVGNDSGSWVTTRSGGASFDGGSSSKYSDDSSMRAGAVGRASTSTRGGDEAASGGSGREYRPRRLEYAGLPNRPTEAKVYMGARNYRSSSVSMNGTSSATRPRSRQRGGHGTIPGLGLPVDDPARGNYF
ncbi:hypothetical protein QBC35DRAFT_468896 [Podospora australis]|uniref:MARVEL domain-containing protein n=1 Tax=Podospora australis TaxID=1536484 RepID=A0AAN6X5E4_9PEZI|nr:hypothetical protein QBC35DRAFT_468896 [Podospora australis]